MSSTFGKGPFFGDDYWASYDIIFEDNSAEVTAITYTWQKAEEYWDPAPPEELITAYSLYLDKCLTAAEETFPQAFVRIFPNPTNGWIHLDLNHIEEGVKSVEVYSTEGYLLAKYFFNGKYGGVDLNMTEYAPGVYYLRIIDKKTVGSKSFIKI